MNLQSDRGLTIDMDPAIALAFRNSTAISSKKNSCSFILIDILITFIVCDSECWNIRYAFKEPLGKKAVESATPAG
jgi:hypothetical protein